MRVYKRGSVWWCDYHDEHGRRCQKSLKIRDGQLAQIAAGKIAEALERRRAGVEAPTPEDAWEARIAAVRARCTPRTQQDTLRIIGQARAFLGADLTARRWHQYVVDRRAAGIKPSTINHHLAVVKGVFPQHVRAALRPIPDRDTHAHEARRRYLTAEEARRLEEACPEGLRGIVRALLRTGCRRGELLAVEWKHISKAGIRVQNLKTVRGAGSSHRLVPLHPDLAVDLEAARLAGLPRPWPWNASAFAMTRAIVAAGKRARVGHVTPHVLRRTFASHLVMAGVDLYRVSRLLGHASVELTARSYAYLSPESLADAVGVLRY